MGRTDSRPVVHLELRSPPERTIWKFALPFDYWLNIKGLVRPGVISVGDDHNPGYPPSIWVVHGGEGDAVDLPVTFIGTGHPLPNTDPYDPAPVGSAHCGAFWWHVFVDPRPEQEHLHAWLRAKRDEIAREP